MLASKIKWASVKSPERSFEKVYRSYGNDVSRLVTIRVLQCVAVCCSVLQLSQCVAVCCSVLIQDGLSLIFQQCVASGSDSSVAVCCSVLQCVAVCCSVLQCVAVRCSVVQCVAVCSFENVYRSYGSDMSRLVEILKSQLAAQLNTKNGWTADL